MSVSSTTVGFCQQPTDIHANMRYIASQYMHNTFTELHAIEARINFDGPTPHPYRPKWGNVEGGWKLVGNQLPQQREQNLKTELLSLERLAKDFSANIKDFEGICREEEIEKVHVLIENLKKACQDFLSKYESIGKGYPDSKITYYTPQEEAASKDLDSLFTIAANMLKHPKLTSQELQAQHKALLAKGITPKHADAIVARTQDQFIQSIQELDSALIRLNERVEAVPHGEKTWELQWRLQNYDIKIVRDWIARTLIEVPKL